MSAKLTRGWRVSSFANDINPVNWKIIVTAYMQEFVVYALGLCISADVINQVARNVQPVNYHTEVLSLLLGFLAALSGIAFGGRIADRTSDYGYQERKYAGQAAVAAAAASNASPQVNTGDNTTINAAPAIPPVAPPADAPNTAQPVSTAPVAPVAPARAFDPGA